MMKASIRCPACNEKFSPATRTRTITVDQAGRSETIYLANCRKCANEYEVFASPTSQSGADLEDRAWLWMVPVAVLALSLIDGLLSIHLTSRGARELNPILEYYIALGPAPFLLVKGFLTIAAVALFVYLRDHSFFGGRVRGVTLVNLSPFPFIVVVLYQVTLLG